MRLFPKLLLTLFIVISVCIVADAQTGAPAKPPEAKVIHGGVLNGKAKSLPKPVYPAEAVRDKITGKVTVKILIDIDGSVASATVVSGPPSLQQAAVDAARLAKFSPTTLKGDPAKVSGVITYNFVAETNEDRLKMLIIATVLTTSKHFVNADGNAMKEIFEGEDIFADGAVEFPEFKKELSPLASFDKLTPEKRREAVDYALTSIEINATGSDKWQFKVGKEFGEMFGPMMLLISQTEEPELEQLRSFDLKTRLNTIRDLTLSAPADFPADVLVKLKEFADLGKSEFATLEDFMTFFTRFEALIQIISPDMAPSRD